MKGYRLALAGLCLALVCGVAELLAGLGGRWGWWPFGTGFRILGIAVAADLAAVALTLVAAVLALRARRGTSLCFAGLALSLAVAAPPLYQLRLAKQLPPIHDISTDSVNPPRFVAVLPLRKDAKNSTDYSAQTAALQKQAYPDIAPAMLNLPPARAFARAERAARAMGWDIVSVAPAQLRIEATATTLLFGFKDDVVIRVTAEGEGSRVDLRSLSRVGKSDIGANARRIRKYLRRLAAD